MPVDIIVFGAIAVFVLLRLYGVLGQPMGHDDRHDRNHSNKPKDSRDTSFDLGGNVIELTPRELKQSDPKEDDFAKEDQSLSADVKAGVQAIRAEERSFRMKHFLEGASVAFDMVMESFNKGDRETLRNLLSANLYQEFTKEMDERSKQESYTETTLVSVVEVLPTDVTLEQRKARISVRFITEQIHVLRNRDGSTLKDSASAIEQVEDVWVFERDVRSQNPNWSIVGI
ncbi:MAG: Tim44 domain-containing protein [Alphaproteobacteria bacterium]|nr:MAG: Tim44 domain-containing protein [Alphaproteobacteria bacterium]TAF15506.1 MAG: Tim44 domain-containing protein [Alphaproteobacteria bacterium]TAF40957.1 MAG: Tim44 domain-containing protein [Alphaproteobacteria bacterium]